MGHSCFRLSNQIEIWRQTDDGMLVFAHRRAIYDKVTMLQKIRPANATTDHLFIGTSRNMHFTLSWDAASEQLKTEHSFQDISEKYMRESLCENNCLMDPSGQFLVMDVYEGFLSIVPIKKPKKGESAYLDTPVSARMTELYVKSAAFLDVGTDTPRLALLHEDAM